MPRYMFMVKGREPLQAPPPALMEAMGREAADLMKDGRMQETGGPAATAVSHRVRVDGGRVRVLDGPFSEAKEVVGGYAIMNCRDRAEALEAARWLMQMHADHWPGWEGETEVRQILGPEEFPEHRG
ncbi:MAG TPA: YciI family protein [Vicinamibacteria bacterium]|nr:YciI family protein [Vicinamibacteria bacterium]